GYRPDDSSGFFDLDSMTCPQSLLSRRFLRYCPAPSLLGTGRSRGAKTLIGCRWIGCCCLRRRVVVQQRRARDGYNAVAVILIGPVVVVDERGREVRHDRRALLLF